MHRQLSMAHFFNIFINLETKFKLKYYAFELRIKISLMRNLLYSQMRGSNDSRCSLYDPTVCRKC